MPYDYDPFGVLRAMDCLGGSPGGPPLWVEAEICNRQHESKLHKERLRAEKMSQGLKFLILDFRAAEEDGLDDALVLDTANTLEDARKAAKLQGGGVIYNNTGEMISFQDLIEVVEA